VIEVPDPLPGRYPLGRCPICGLPYEANIEGVVLPCERRRDDEHVAARLAKGKSA